SAVLPAVRRHGDARAAYLGYPPAHLPVFAHGQRTDHHPCRARIEDALHVVARAHAAAGLYTQPGAVADRAHQFEQGVTARTCGIEVDQVQPACALVGVGPCERQRIIAVPRLLRVVALGEAHDAAVADVDRGIQGVAAHAGSMLRKLCSRRAPAAAERSGWNCAPMTLPRRTAAANAWPWVVPAMQSGVRSAA